MSKKQCCHCCKNCYPDSKMNREVCEICTRLGKVCPFGHGKCDNKSQPTVPNPIIIDQRTLKYQDIKKIGSTVPVYSENRFTPHRILGSRPISSSIKGPLNYSLGPALPIYNTSSMPATKYSRITSPIIERPSLPINSHSKVSQSYIVQPVYYDVQLKIPIQIYNDTRLTYSRRIEVNPEQPSFPGESIRTRKSHSTFANSKIKVNEFEGNSVRVPMNPDDLRKMIGNVLQ